MTHDLTRRNFLRSGLAAVAVGASAGGLSTAGGWALRDAAAAAPAQPFLPYSSGSYFRTPVRGISTDAGRTTAFRTFMKTHPDQAGISYPRITGLGGNQWGTTTHVSASGDPIWTLANPRTETRILSVQGFHMADSVVDRVPTGTQDRPFLVVDPIYGYSIFCTDVVPDKATRTIKVSSSAVFFHTSNGLDKRNPLTDDKRNFASRGRIPDAMVIRPDLLKAAIANNTGLGHVLHLFLVETRTTDGFRNPMVGRESNKDGFGAEGERIAIRADVDLVGRGLTGAALAVARTLQTHGAYIGDNSGSSTMLKGAQGTSTYNPYSGTNLSRDCLKALTWDDFVVLRG